MSLRPFRTVPKDIREWTRWAQQQDFKPKNQDVTVGSATAIDFSKGESAAIALSETTTVSITNPPAKFGELCIEITQGSKVARITWPASVKWASGTAPVITTTKNAVDVVKLWTRNGGTTWYGSFLQNYS